MSFQEMVVIWGRDRWISVFSASLVFRVNSRTARAKQRTHVSITKTNKQELVDRRRLDLKRG